MPSFEPSAFEAALANLLPASCRHLWVAFSGGLDSTVLLTACAAVARANPRWSVTAVHVDHGLHPNSARWAKQCAQVAADLGVPFVGGQVSVDLESGEGLESAARHARYDFLRDKLDPGAALLTAHHADDQIETFLLALARGSGVAGLSAMPSVAPFAAGIHVRPLLMWTRAELEVWAREHELRWLDDPSNVDRSRDRNFLRHEVLPRLRERWPQIAPAAVRASGHLGAAQRLLDAQAQADLSALSVGECLDVEPLSALALDRRHNALRYWLRSHGARPPSTRQLEALEHDMFSAADDRCPEFLLADGTYVRRHRGLLYCERDWQEPSGELRWRWGDPLELPASCGTLAMIGGVETKGLAPDRLPAELTVRFRTGGERLEVAGRPLQEPGHHKLKKLLQELSVLPWWRARLPLIWAGDELVAVADLWVSAQFATDHVDGLRIEWRERPAIFAVERDEKKISD
jgi:tRNA(Ile)-lysidine synthase